MRNVTAIVLVLVAFAAVSTAVTNLPASATDASGTGGKHHVVFQVTAEGEEHWASVLGNVENLRKAFGPGNSEVEVVGHGKGLGMLMATNKGLAERMRMLSENGVVFAACENTMQKMNVTKEQLLPFVVTVDSGVAQVVRRQEQGWSYIKS